MVMVVVLVMLWFVVSRMVVLLWSVVIWFVVVEIDVIDVFSVCIDI